MRNICLIISLVLLLTGNTFGHNNEPGSSSRIISGRVLDKETGEALAGVKIQVKGTDTSCYTDLNGNYLLTLSSKAETELEVNLAGYTSLTLKATDVSIEKDLVISAR